MADIMAERLPALSEREQGVLMDRIIAKLKDMDLYSGIGVQSNVMYRYNFLHESCCC